MTNSTAGALLSTNLVVGTSKNPLKNSNQSSAKHKSLVNKQVANQASGVGADANVAHAIIGEESSDKEQSDSSKKPSSDEANPKKLSDEESKFSGGGGPQGSHVNSIF